VSGCTVIGNVNVDLIVRAEGLPPPGQERVVDEVDCRVGGAAANAALAMAALGAPPRLVGCVGDDHFGRYLLDELSARDLADDVRVVPGRPTGVSIAVGSADRDRSFLLGLGALAAFDLGSIPRDALEEPFVLLTGSFTLPALRGEATAGLLRTVRASGGRTFLDTGWDPDGWPTETRDEIRALLPLVDVFLPNDLEASTLAATDDVERAARELRDRSGGAVVVKRGADGAFAVGPDAEELSVPAPEVPVVDTVGAGDAFDGALLVALSQGRSFDEAVRFATEVGSTVVSRRSADRYPTPADVGQRRDG
jgi:sugar/nucleoside kinase (ribokinase family)